MPDVITTSTFFALLALVAGLLAVVVAAARVSAPTSVWPAVRDGIGPAALPLAAAVAAVATLGSLYYSEIVGFEPCPLCWYQRIAMYPLTVLLIVGWVRRDAAVRWYVWPIAAVGAAISVWHYTLEWLPADDTALCGPGGGCGVADFRIFGFVSLPFMALMGFAAIAALGLVAAARPASEGRSTHAGGDEAESKDRSEARTRSTE